MECDHRRSRRAGGACHAHFRRGRAAAWQRTGANRGDGGPTTSGNLYQQKVRAAVHTINGFGKVVGFEQVRELGVIEAPIALTNTLNVGLVLDALVQDSIRQKSVLSASGLTAGSVNILVGETNDSYLNDIQGRHVRLEHVLERSKCNQWPGSGGSGGSRDRHLVFWLERRHRQRQPLVARRLGRVYPGRVSAIQFWLAFRPDCRGISGWVASISAKAAASNVARLDHDHPGDGCAAFLAPAEAVVLTSDRRSGRTGSMLNHGSGDFVIAFSTAQLIPHHSTTPTMPLVGLANEARS